MYWVRHGKTSANQENQYYGKLDLRLTQEGIMEIKQIKTNFNDCINVYSSPAARAIETASILFNGIYFKVDARLLERDMGIFEGLDDKNLRQKYPEERKEWYSNWKQYVIPEGESAMMQYERVVSFIKELEKENKDAIVISNAGTIRLALCYMFGGNLDMFCKFHVATGVVVGTYYENDYWYMDLSQENY
ncbi:MAG: histidine phosphatase family protein [Cellulosilyticaceae bacterium]